MKNQKGELMSMTFTMVLSFFGFIFSGQDYINWKAEQAEIAKAEYYQQLDADLQKEFDANPGFYPCRKTDDCYHD